MVFFSGEGVSPSKVTLISSILNEWTIPSQIQIVALSLHVSVRASLVIPIIVAMQNYSDIIKMAVILPLNFIFQCKNNIYSISALLEIDNPPK